MSKLAEFKALEAKLAAQLKQLDELKNDSELKREIEFEEKLRGLMAEYGISLPGIISLLDPQANQSGPPLPATHAANADSVKLRFIRIRILARSLRPKAATTGC